MVINSNKHKSLILNSIPFWLRTDLTFSLLSCHWNNCSTYGTCIFDSSPLLQAHHMKYMLLRTWENKYFASNVHASHTDRTVSSSIDKIRGSCLFRLNVDELSVRSFAGATTAANDKNYANKWWQSYENTKKSER